MKRWGVAVGLATMVFAGTAAADEFDNQASTAKQVRGSWALGALLWSQVTECGKHTNDLERRQCEGVRAGRRGQNNTNTFLVVGDSGAVTVGEFNEKKKSVSFSVAPCFACEQPVDVEGEQFFVVGGGKVGVTDGKVEVSSLLSSSETFPSAEAAATWKADVLPRLRAEFLLGFGKSKRWKTGGVQGMQVQVTAYRIYDPCTGVVLASKPSVDNLPADKSFCGEQPEAEPEPEIEPEPDKPAAPVLPAKLSPYQISQALAPARREAQACFSAYGVTGDASFRITVNNEGKVTGLDQTGDFADTPTGDCLEKSIRTTVFPKSRKDLMSFDYPVVLR